MKIKYLLLKTGINGSAINLFSGLHVICVQLVVFVLAHGWINPIEYYWRSFGVLMYFNQRIIGDTLKNRESIKGSFQVSRPPNAIKTIAITL